MSESAFFGRDMFLRDNGIVVTTDERSALHTKQLYSTDMTNAALASSGTLLFQGKTPSDKKIHLISIGIYTTSSKVLVEFIEAPTVTDGSASVPIGCRHRIYPVPSEMTAYSDPTGISGGTTLINRHVGTGVNKASFATEINAGWILKPSTDYILRLTNESSGAEVVSLAMLWTEKPLRSTV